MAAGVPDSAMLLTAGGVVSEPVPTVIWLVRAVLVVSPSLTVTVAVRVPAVALPAVFLYWMSCSTA